MITDTMKKAINEQINAELWSAYLYLSMSIDAEAKVLRGISNWFYVQWLEEQDHARILHNYLTDQGVRVELLPIEKVQKEWDSPLEMFRDTLRHEKKVTDMIYNLVRLAIKEQDFATLSRLQWFVDEQVEEERSAADIAVEFDAAGRDYGVIRDIDDKLAGRKYQKPDILK